MKKRIFALLLALTALLCVLPASAEGESAVSTDMADLLVYGNAGGNYINGNGTRSASSESFLYVNEDGGVTIVQYAGKSNGLSVSEYDSQLNFLNCRTVPLPNITKWGGFCAGEDHNYVLYGVPGWLEENGSLNLVQYDKDWNEVARTHLNASNTSSLFNNDVDMVEANGRVSIITQHTFSEGTARGHVANMHLEFSVNGLSCVLQNATVGGYDGYTSHSFRPEIVAAGSKLYTFDRSDSYPGPYLLKAVFEGSLASGSMSSIQRMAFNDWGSAGNAVAAGDEGALLAYNYAPGTEDNTATNVYLHYTSPAGSNTVQVTTTGGAGTPLVGAVNESSGFVLWNPDIRYFEEEGDTLHYAVYAVNGGNVTVGRTFTAEGHYLSDCDPIPFDGGLLWYTIEKGDVVFHQLKPNQAPTKTVIHTELKTLPAREATCDRVGLTEGVGCANCGEAIVPQQEIPGPPHKIVISEGREPTCSYTGWTEKQWCSVCDTVLVEREYLAPLPHTEEVLPGYPAGCQTTGRTDGMVCSVCGEITVPQEVIPVGDHLVEEVPEDPATCWRTGTTAGTRCADCGVTLSGLETLPLADHTPVEDPGVPSTVTSCGIAPGIRCEVCEEWLSGGEETPELMFMIREHHLEGQKLHVKAEVMEGLYALMAAFYDEKGAFLGVDYELLYADIPVDPWYGDYGEPLYDLTFTPRPGSASFRIFIMNDSSSKWRFCPVCEPRGGTL